ncbi:MAG: type I DNA topoisomerase [Gammaproteobacteria bacterium PRO9]|nr:type I DNA topoisomerase [Gammaproteobacteria bacterium PRO9]
MSNVVVVESPAKAKTIEKYLGKDFKVLASYGHIRDLLEKDGAVDPDHGYLMKYTVAEDKEKHINAIASALKKGGDLYLATDPDREGEAISWHLQEVLNERGLLESRKVYRVVFYEITQREVQEAIRNPREVSIDLVNAYRTRRAMDHLIGFKLSPLLWRKISPKLSAGRVQSPALRMLVEREEAIEAFVSQEYWSIAATTGTAPGIFSARLVEYAGNKVVDTFNREKPETFSFRNAGQAGEARQKLEAAAGGRLRVQNVERSQRRRKPAPPFTTSTLQQEASRKLGFRARGTMQVAQKLYEGIAISEGTVGLITYMRTDSVNLAAEAVDDIRAFIVERYGKESLPATPNTYKTTAKNAQEAHEGIRPTSIRRTPESLRGHLNDEQYKLYSLIWKRTIASQMEPAVYDMLAVDLVPAGQAEVGRFRATGSTLVSPGFIAVYLEGRDEGGDDDTDVKLPSVKQGDVLPLVAITPDQHFTEPPPRYTEASLVKALEERGIGRPSTYATIISTLLNRQYAELKGRALKPTDGGRIVSGFLTTNFTQYVDYDFTAHMEDELDEVSRGEREWVPVLDDFWKPFAVLLKDKEQTITREEAVQVRELGTDPKSGRPVSARFGRYGAFIQIGTREDEEKPKWKGLQPGQSMFTIELPDALELFKLPRALGTLPTGEPVSANTGQFGPYVQYETVDQATGEVKKKYVSLRDQDPLKITLEEAIEAVRAKQEADANKLIKNYGTENLRILRGRWGPYLTDGEKNARLPKDREPESITLEEARELIANAPLPKRRWGRPAAKKKTAKKRVAAKAPATADPGTPAKKVAKKSTKKKAVRKKTAGKAVKKSGQSKAGADGQAEPAAD